MTTTERPGRPRRASRLRSPGEVAALIGSAYGPTVEQSDVIGSPAVAPSVVIAGAGSGKTETMAARVVWLVANGLVAPDRVLGLTFTRKAAGELQQRLRLRLAGLHRVDRTESDPPGEPTVLTYAAYAGRLVDEHGIRIGAEPGAVLLSDAARWQVADAVFRSYRGQFAIEPKTLPTMVARMLRLAGELADHLVGLDELAAFGESVLAHLEALPPSPRSRGREWPVETEKFVSALVARQDFLPLLELFAQAKREQGVLDFADQMTSAATLAALPAVAEIERSRYDVVLLDEYQDTGHAQIQMLSALFGDGHPVTAVGDPLQSIYGWRGASAGNIHRFASRFPRADGTPATRFGLMTSWRNDRRILAAANRVADELRDPGGDRLGPREGAGDGRVRIAFARSEADEAAWLAGLVAADWAEPNSPTWTDPASRTAAVLVRRRALIPRIVDALRSQGLPVQVLDLGGLIHLPEVADVVATLRVLVDARAGGALARLLTGARLRIGAADLVALNQRARVLARHTEQLLADLAGRAPEDDAAEPEGTFGTETRLEPSLVEALDDLGDPGLFSAAGFARLSRFAGELRTLRRRLELSLPDLIVEIERMLGLDIETAVAAGGESGRANLDQFIDEAARFVGRRSASGVSGSQVQAFLSFLAAAEDEEYGLRPPSVEPRGEVVQVLTVHGSKGLEWDLVAVPGMHATGFPTQAREQDWTRAEGMIPSPLRGDRDDLAELDLAGCEHRGEVDKRLKAHSTELKARHRLEERRLAYVAFTRARHLLLCSGAAWGDGQSAREPSQFLLELQALAGETVDDGGPPTDVVEVDGWHEPEPDETAPEPDTSGAGWPADPLAARRPAVAEAATLVRAARRQVDQQRRSDQPHGPDQQRRTGRQHGPDQPGDAERPADRNSAAPASERVARWRVDVAALRAEHARARGTDRIDVTLPERLSASDLVALSSDEAAFARRLRRPVPQRPSVMARRGSRLHEWLEHRWSSQTLMDIDELPGAVDADIDDAELDRLKAAFLSSEWADRTPVAVEVPFEMAVGHTVVRGRMDAVFAAGDGRFVVVDWKTGRPPSATEEPARAVQLAVYRMAWARLAGIADADVGRVSAAFVYVAAGVTVAPADLLGPDELRRLVTGA